MRFIPEVEFPLGSIVAKQNSIPMSAISETNSSGTLEISLLRALKSLFNESN